MHPCRRASPCIELRLRVTGEPFLTETRGGCADLTRARWNYSVAPANCVACLSNTDPVNVRKFDEEFQLQNWFDECFYCVSGAGPSACTPGM